MISKTSEYALRAVIYLAQQDTDAPTRAGEIAQALGLPANYLSKILHLLARAGVLSSERGPRGGFRLGREASEIPLAAVIEPFDSLARRRFCLLGRPECSDESSCAVHERWKRASEPVVAFFRETVVADLVGVTGVRE